MREVVLGFKAFDVHELLIHFVADAAGLYRKHDLEVQLLDTTFVAAAALPRTFMSVACGAALLGWLAGEAQRVVFVAAERPMFWLYRRDGRSGLEELCGGRIAGYPPFAPPAQFLKTLMDESQLDATVHACASDAARLGLLLSGGVDAALLSSAIPPALMASRGFVPALQLGEHLRIATTGLAVAASLVDQCPDLLRDMVLAQREALRLLHREDALPLSLLGSAFSLDADIAEPTLALTRSSFTTDGVADPGRYRDSIRRLANRPGSTFTAIDLYDPLPLR